MSPSPRSQVTALLTDFVMPGGRGVHLARQIREPTPTISILFMSGCGGEELSPRGRAPRRSTVLAKPVGYAALLQALSSLLQRRLAPDAALG